MARMTDKIKNIIIIVLSVLLTTISSIFYFYVTQNNEEYKIISSELQNISDTLRQWELVE